MAISNDSTTPPTHVGRDTALLLAPQTVAWQLSFFLFGIYLALLFNTVRDPIFSKFARAVKIVNWLVFALVLIYNSEYRPLPIVLLFEKKRQQRLAQQFSHSLTIYTGCVSFSVLPLHQPPLCSSDIYASRSEVIDIGPCTSATLPSVSSHG